jgi:hypothetical protein
VISGGKMNAEIPTVILEEIDMLKARVAVLEGSKIKKFTPPTVEMVKAYCDERKNGINAQGFVDFYESKGWMIGKNKMKKWEAAVRTWEKNRSVAQNDDCKGDNEGFTDEPHAYDITQL